jgi:hypothetical protein
MYDKMIGFCNREERCLLRGRKWILEWNSLRFVFDPFNAGIKFLYATLPDEIFTEDFSI